MGDKERLCEIRRCYLARLWYRVQQNMTVRNLNTFSPHVSRASAKLEKTQLPTENAGQAALHSRQHLLQRMSDKLINASGLLEI